MTTAIVTITCPQCGGKVQGIEQTDQPQTIPCTYCKTELHVPRVGGAIVRETRVVHEVREVAVEPLRPRPKPIVPAMVLAIGGAVVMVFVIARMHGDADDTIARIDRDRAAREACEANCNKQCESAPPSHAPTPDLGDPKLTQDMDETMRKADITVCEVDCTRKANCFGLSASPP
jgi:hypothetical protein